MKYGHALSGIVIALSVAGCMTETEGLEEEQEQAQAQEQGAPEVAEASTEQSLSGHYCVDQSYASAERLGGYVNVCWRSPNWSTTLSHGHKVTWVTGCSDFSSAYVIVYSHWNAAYYYMRKDALSPC